MIGIETTAGTARMLCEIEAFWGVKPFVPKLECNMGAPMSRTREIARQLTLRATLLGSGSDHFSCPKVNQAALNFADEDPVPYVHRLVYELGYASPEDAREALLRLVDPLVCCAAQRVYPTHVSQMPPEEVLETALILGLSTSSHFDPGRPLIWTRASLTRRLWLYDVRGFYA